jgi:TolB-like protein/class 3 adenylate cyclase/Tfp pilus assembly protein PilF
VAATRRLAAIMFTDMVGFTASAQANEADALKLLREQEKLTRPLLKTHKGREIKSTGDGFLVEFDSALRAVQCAIDIHQHLQERNAKPGVTPIQLRIGVHLGDVEERGGDIFGDSVNLAARIEPLAEPGGICISEPVFGQVRNKIPNKLEKLEPKLLKNIRFPLDIYRVVLPWTVRGPPSAISGPTGLAVLPFANISPDPKDEYIADGLTEELITVLSHLRGLRVIARTSVTPYKSTSKGVAQIGDELGVSSVLEGSVRKAGSRLRITAQLIDVGTQGHLWTNSYDRELDDVFAIQTDIAKQVADALKVELRATEGARLEARRPVRADSYLAYLKGRTLFSMLSIGALNQAKEQFELAISLDPKNVAAYSGLADVVQMLRMAYQGRPVAASGETGRALVDRAIELDPNSAEAHTSLGLIEWCDFEYIAAERETKLALALNPSYSYAHLQYACLLEDEGRTDEALVEHALAEGTNPLSPSNLASSARLLIWLGRFEEALVKIRRLGELNPSGLVYHSQLADYHAARSNPEECLKELDQCEKLDPDPNGKAIARARSYALTGEKEQARALLRQLEMPQTIPATELNIAEMYAELGDLDECFRLLDKRVKDRFIPFQQWRLDPRLQHLRDDPRFQMTLQRMNLA